jgi:hypothetical protein
MAAKRREDNHAVRLSDEEFRRRLHNVVGRSGLSKRALSGAMGRDPGYIAALLDPTRPSRARPGPEDLLMLGDGHVDAGRNG